MREPIDFSGYVAPDAPGLFRRSFAEIRARAATSRYWAQRLRFLTRRRTPKQGRSI